MPKAVYYEKYNNMLEVLRNQGIDIGCKPELTKYELTNFDPPFKDTIDASNEELGEAKTQARSKYIVMGLLSTSDQNR